MEEWRGGGGGVKRKSKSLVAAETGAKMKVLRRKSEIKISAEELNVEKTEQG